MNTQRTGPIQGQGRHDGRGDRRRSRVSITALRILMGASLGVLLSVAAAQSEPVGTQPATRVHEIQWLHPAPAGLRSFIIFVSSAPEEGGNSQFVRQLDVGIPGGRYPAPFQIFSALVPVASNESVAVAAVGRDGTQSALSVWMRPQLTRPGQPLLVEP